MPYLPRSRVFSLDRDGVVGLACEYCPSPGISRDFYDPAASVECLGLFTTDDRARPVILVRITRPLKLPRVVALAVTVAADRRTPAVKEVDRIEWRRWCGLPDGKPGSLHGDHPADYEPKRAAEEIDVLFQ